MLTHTLLQQAWTVTASAAAGPRASVPRAQLSSCVTGRDSYHWLSRGPLRTQCSAATIGNDKISSSSNSESTSNSGSQKLSSSKSNSRARKQLQQYRRRVAAYTARLPRNRKYGVDLRDKTASGFEQMRLVVGYYDLPQNRNVPRPPPVSHTMINNMQTLLYMKAVDPYYKLSLLSYRSKLQNEHIVQGLGKVQSFLWELAAPPELVPVHLTETNSEAKCEPRHHEEAQQSDLS